MADYVLLSTEQIKSVVEEVLQKHLYNNVCALETENEDILSPKEVCKLLKVSPKTLQTMRDERRIPFSQFGRKIYVKRADLEAFMEKHYINSRG